MALGSRAAGRLALVIVAGVALAAGVVGAAAGAPVGKLRFVDAEFDGHGSVTGLQQAYGVAVSPDGKQVYAIGLSGGLTTFKRNRRGRLRFVRAQLNGQGGITAMQSPTAVAVSRDGRNVYVTSTGVQSAVLTFKRKRRSGRLRFVNARIDGQGGVEGIADPCCQIAISPDGRNVYVPGTDSDAIATFRRKGRKGKLRFVNARVDGQGGVSGLGEAIGVVTSSDGRNVYAIGEDDDALVTFKRSRKGKLRFVNAKVDGQGGVNGLAGPCCSLAISRDGRSVYVPADADQAVAIFRRKPKTGKLRFRGAKVEGVGGVSGMPGPLDVVVSRDGRSVYVASYDDPSAVVRFKRSKKGKLGFAGAIRETLPGIEGLDGAWRLALSPDGRNLYAASFLEGALVTFKRRARR